MIIKKDETFLEFHCISSSRPITLIVPDERMPNVIVVLRNIARDQHQTDAKYTTKP